VGFIHLFCGKGIPEPRKANKVKVSRFFNAKGRIDNNI